MLASVGGYSVMNNNTNIPSGLAFEIHFTTGQLAALWGTCEKTVQRWFEDEPGVLRSTGGKRSHLRIPASVAARVHAEKSASTLDEIRTTVRHRIR